MSELDTPYFRETAWLCESRPGQPTWWSLTDTEGDGGYFTPDSLKALRFARKEDAEAYIDDAGWTEVYASEHEWSDPRRPFPAPATQEVTSYEIVDQTGCLHTTTDPKHAEELRQALMRPELHEDTARLDWLEMQMVKATAPGTFAGTVWATPGPDFDGLRRSSDLRAQIDRARAAEKDAKP